MKALYRYQSIRKIATVLALTGSALCLFGEEPVIHSDLPEPICLNGNWQFKLLPDAESAREYDYFYKEGFDTSSFDTIPVPSNWALEGFEEPRYVNGSESEGFYLYTFSAPESVKDLRAILHFGGVWVSAEVWLNGENLGRHDSGFTEFSYDISRQLIPGAINHIAVRVRQQIPASLFKFDANDDWGLAGIFRDVWIDFTPKHLYIENVEVTTDLDDRFENAYLKMRVFIARNERDHYIAPSPPFNVRAVLSDLDGGNKQERVKQITVAGAHNGRDNQLEMKVDNPRLWTAETPELYRLRMEIERGGEIVHRWEERIGFREISTDGGILRVNGQPVKLRGVASHDLHPDTGRATTPEQWMKDIRLMKDANINAIRMAHYPHAEGFIQLCDAYGLYVLDEIPLGFGGDRMSNPIFASGMFLRIHETIQRDRNHPSVIIWDFGNEDGLTYLHTVGLRTIKGIDPTRPVLLPFRAEPELPAEVDILAPHYWMTDAYDTIGASALRPVVSTEYTHALGTDGLGELEQRWEALTSHPAGGGAMIWLWADQALLRPINGNPVLDPMEDKESYTREGSEWVRHSNAGEDAIYDSHGNYGTDGIVNPDRSLTWDYFEAKAVYAPVEILTTPQILVPSDSFIHVPVYNGYDFTNLDSCTIEWSLYRDKKVIQSGSTRLSAAPHETTDLVLSVDRVASDGVYYFHVKVVRKDGSEMVTRSVRLYPSADLPEPGTGREDVRIKKHGSIVELISGGNAFSFNKKSGEIESISTADVFLAGKSNIVVWRKSTFNERNRYDRRENQHDWNSFMQDIEGKSVSWDLNTTEDGVEIRAETVYTEDELNSVTVNYKYSVKRNGQLDVAIEVHPEMDVPELPEIGIILDLPADVSTLSWLGEGPGQSLPGKQAATRFGWWEVNIRSEEAAGTRSGLDWARLTYASGSVLQVLEPAGIRLETTSGKPRLRILTQLGGAWTKNGPPEKPMWHLDLEPGKVFSGEFTILPAKEEEQ